MSTVLVISDTHFPYEHKRSIRKIMDLVEETNPDYVVQIGDLLDQYVFSKYSRKLKITPEQDIRRGLKAAAAMWTEIQERSDADCIQVLGNHDMRLAKRIAEKLPEAEGMLSHKELYNFKKVDVLESDRDYVEIDGVVYCHGWLSKSIDHAKHFLKPTVHGHRHRPTIETFGKHLWSMDVGLVADENQSPLQYTMSRTTNWRRACGMVEDGQPRLILL